MVYFILVLVAAIEVIVLLINRPVFANIPYVQVYIVPLLVVIVITMLLSRNPKRFMRWFKQGLITISVVVLVFVPVLYAKNLPLYGYNEAKKMLAQREQLLLSQFQKGKYVYPEKDSPKKYRYLFKVNRGNGMLEYVFDPYTGGYEVVTDVIKK